MQTTASEEDRHRRRGRWAALAPALPLDSSALRHRDLSASPLNFGVDDNTHSRRSTEFEANQKAVHRPEDHTGAAVDPVADPELTQMVKDRLELRLRAILEG